MRTPLRRPATQDVRMSLAESRTPSTGRARVAIRALAMTLFALLTPDLGQSATDGLLGLVSQATSDISIIVGDTAQASGLEDIVLAPWSDGQAPPRGTANACIYSSTGLYQVSAASSNGAGTNFRLQSGSDFIIYTVRWNDGVNGLQRVDNGIPLSGRVGDSTSLDCGGADPATIQVNISLPRIQAAPFGSYVDTLTVMITPQ